MSSGVSSTLVFQPAAGCEKRSPSDDCAKRELIAGSARYSSLNNLKVSRTKDDPSVWFSVFKANEAFLDARLNHSDMRFPGV